MYAACFSKSVRESLLTITLELTHYWELTMLHTWMNKVCLYYSKIGVLFYIKLGNYAQ